MEMEIKMEVNMETGYLAENTESMARHDEKLINNDMMDQFGKIFKLMEDQTNEIKNLKRTVEVLEKDQSNQIKNLKTAVQVLGKEVYSLKEEVKKFKKSSEVKIKNSLPTLPFETKECFLEFEDEVKANETGIQTTLKIFFLTIQSADLTNYIKIIMKKLLTDNAAKSFTWLGLGGNIAIKNFNVITILKDAVVTKFPNATEEETDRQIKKIFYNTKGRLNKSAKNISKHNKLNVSEKKKNKT